MAFIAPAFDEAEKRAWCETLLDSIPGLRLVGEGASVKESDVEGAIVYYPPPGQLSRFPRLRLVISLSVGVETILSDPELPDIPVVRLMSAELQALMKEYVVYQVLRVSRGFDSLEESRREHRWVWSLPSKPASEWRVLVLGLGQLGRPAAEALRDLGFHVSGWSRRTHSIPGIHCGSGRAGLDSLLPVSDILVCLLPLTVETKGLLNAEVFSRLPKGASLINVGRSHCLHEWDLLRALEEGILSRATLDVFDAEPLPQNHVFWSHPRINITPHAAAHPRPVACTSHIVECIECCKRGVTPPGVVNRLLGY